MCQKNQKNRKRKRENQKNNEKKRVKKPVGVKNVTTLNFRIQDKKTHQIKPKILNLPSSRDKPKKIFTPIIFITS